VSIYNFLSYYTKNGLTLPFSALLLLGEPVTLRHIENNNNTGQRAHGLSLQQTDNMESMQ
jgi:hypothetical protein